MSIPPQSISSLLAKLSEGDESAADTLFPLVYGELHRIASVYMSRERDNHTLQPTALIHEAYLSLVKPAESGQPEFENIRHFMATAAVVMRRILVNHAKAKKTKKRGEGAAIFQLDEVSQAFGQRSVDLVALDEALQRLAQVDEVQHRLVELRFFGGMTVAQCAEHLEMSERAVYYEWSHARAWLRSQIEVE